MNLLKDLQELAELAGKMQHLAQMAPGLAAKGELTALEDLTRRRKRMAARSQALITRIMPALERWEEWMGAMSEAEATRCWALAGEIEQAFRDCLKADQQLREILGGQLKATQAELNRIKQTTQAMRAYQEASGRSGPHQP